MEKWKPLLQKISAKVWVQAGLVFILALLPRLIAFYPPVHHNEFYYVLVSRNLLLSLVEMVKSPLTSMGVFRGVTLTWESAALLYLRYWLHITHIWPSSLSAATSLQQFAVLEAHPIEILMTMRLSTVLTTAAGTAFIYALSQRLWGWRSAALVTAFVSLDPFFLGFSRLLNTDGHVATWTGVALLAFLVYLQQGGYRLAGLTALATALALLSKPSAILLVGFLPLAAIGYGLAIGGARREGARRALWGALVIAGVALLWQVVTWLTGQGEDFLTALRSTLGGYATNPGELKFLLGKTSLSPAWTFYPVTLLARTTPGIVAGILLGTAALFKMRDKEEIARWLILASFVVLFTTFISLANIKIDRYLLPVYPALGVMGARGLLLFWQWAKGRCPALLLNTGIASLAFAHLVGMLTTFPYYTTYYTPLLGPKAVDWIQVGYGEGLEVAADYLNHKPNAESLKVLSWYGTEVMGPRFRGTTWQPQAVYGDFVVTPQNLHFPSFLTADYVVTYINEVQRGLPDPRIMAYFQSRRPEMEVWLVGLRYAAVYPGPIYGGSVPGEAVSLTYPSASPIRLLGYQMQNTEDTGGYALTLFWRAETPVAQNYAVAIKLLSADGQVWASSSGWPVGGLLPTSLWEASVVVRDDYRLRPLPGTPPGTYFLEVTMVDSVTGQPLPLTSGTVGPGGGLVLQTVTLEQLVPAYHDEALASTVEVPQPRDVAQGVKLLGYSPAAWQGVRPGESLSLVLLWQATRSAPPDVPLRWQLTRNGSTPVELGTTFPGTGRYPLSRWQKGEVVRDQFTVRLPAHLEEGPYQLRAWLPDGASLAAGTVEVSARQHTFDIPQVTHPLDAAWGDVARLLGYDLDLSGVQSGRPVILTLYWQAVAEEDVAYKVFVHLLDADGRIVTQVDREPQAGAAPTTSWLAGEIVTDKIEIPMSEAAATTRSIVIGLYEPATGKRLPVLNSAGVVVGDSVTIPIN
jgi:hypothetical protein